MRGLLAGLVLAVMVLGVALAAATLGAVGVAAIGWLLSRWFELSQWQGTVVALVVATALGYLLYRLAAVPNTPAIWSSPDAGDEWLAGCEEAEESCAEAESPIVPWRRSRQKVQRRS